MWLRLDDAELIEVSHALRIRADGLPSLEAEKLLNLVDRLNEEPDPDTAAFAAAVDTDDDLEVDGDVVISRGDEGAFVMAWVYVSNEAAGIETVEVDD